jgi:hypothetical protein
MMVAPPIIWDWQIAERLAQHCEQQARQADGTVRLLRGCAEHWPQHWRGRAQRAASRTLTQLLREQQLSADEWQHCAQQLRAASARARAEQLRSLQISGTTP